MKKKVLLLNLPGKEKYLREYFCSKISKARYYYPPIDLAYISGRFDEDKYHIFLIDAIAENLSSDTTIEKINNIAPDYIYFLAGAASFREDRIFIKQMSLKIKNNPKIIGTGDIFRELKKDSFKIFQGIDAINFNFATLDCLKYIEHGKGEIIDNMIYTHENNLIIGEEKFDVGIRNIPIPKRELFNLKNYSNPFSIATYSSVVLTDFSCPFECEFCPYSKIPYAVRPLENVFKEIDILKKMGVNDLFFIDSTFGLNKKRLLELCEGIKKIDINRSCFGRVDLIDEERLKAMKHSGCHTIIFGIESMNQEILDKYNKKTKISQIINAIDLCKKYKIRAGGTFIIGLPGEDRKSIKHTISLSKKLHLDFASFNIATPRIGTHFRIDMIEKGFANPDELNLESTKQKTQVRNSHNLPLTDLVKLQKFAVRSFYLSPQYIIRRLMNLKSFYEFKNSIWEAYYLFFR